MAQFDKFGKCTKDLLSKGFLDDKADKQERRAVDFTGKSSSGVSLSFHAAEKLATGATEGKVTVNRHCNHTGLDTEFVLAPENVKVTLTDSENVDGLTATLTVEGNPSNAHQLFAKKEEAAEGEEAKAAPCCQGFGASFGLQYKHKVNDDVQVAVSAKASREKKDSANFAEVSAAIHHSCGGGFGFSVKSPMEKLQEFKEAEVGAIYHEGNMGFNAAVKGERKEGAVKTTLTVGVIHAYNDATTWGVEGTYALKNGAADDNQVRAVVQRKCGDEQYKLRIAAPSGRVAGAFSTKLGAHSDLSFSAEGDLSKITAGSASDYKFASKLAFNAK